VQYKTQIQISPIQTALQFVQYKAQIQISPIQTALQFVQYKTRIQKSPIQTALQFVQYKTQIQKSPNQTALQFVQYKAQIQISPIQTALQFVQYKTRIQKSPIQTALQFVQYKTNPEISNPDRPAICAVQNKSRNLQSRPPCNLCSTKQFQKSPIQTALKFVHYKTNPEISNPYRPAISAVQNKSRNLQSRLPCNLCSSINFL